MSIIDFLLLAAIAAWFIAAVRFIVRRKKRGCTGCGCLTCENCPVHIDGIGDRQS